jgi:5-oxopent-3-ene-1,2,5-tricarboxylate decarboxylase/2-hydroxyhepta-2,4-diene-1,7-dioate isomerase
MLPPLPQHARGATVLGVLLNHRSAWDALAPAMAAEPYKAPPKSPVLYLKPANTWSDAGQPIVLPPGIAAVQAGATLGIVIGRTCSGVRVAEAMAFVAGYTVVNDISVPHSSFYRPPLKHNCRDSFCPIGPLVVAAARIAAPDALHVRTHVNGRLLQETSTAELMRPIAQLIAEICDFMTLQPGDVLLAGVAHGAPLLHAGDRVRIEIDGLGALENPVLAQEETPA